MTSKVVGHLTTCNKQENVPFKIFSVESLELYLFEKPFFNTRTNKGDVCTKEYITDKFVVVGNWMKSNTSIEITVRSLGVFICNPMGGSQDEYEVRNKEITNKFQQLGLDTILSADIPDNTHLSMYLLGKLFKNPN
ncbi:hypothetical protein [Mucilaginibacter sp.]|jgi:hypothetical protein|uniref:hypothetical protein n=1 Tax=Mucilaginibacter sp. TaxID=1882438 RepID=UPI0035678F11